MAGTASGEAPTTVRATVATACRILAHRRLAEGTLGHVSVRVDEDRCLVRCRGPAERGLGATAPEDIRLVDLDGELVGEPGGWQPPKELPIHTETYRHRPEVTAVVHAHPRSALLCGLARLVPRGVFGAYNIPAMRLALAGVPVYERPVLVTRPALAAELVAAMGDRTVCIMRGHGITVVGPSVEAATVTAVNLDTLLQVTVDLAMLGAEAPQVDGADLAELPDLGSRFNDQLAWSALVYDLEHG